MERLHCQIGLKRAGTRTKRCSGRLIAVKVSNANIRVRRTAPRFVKISHSAQARMRWQIASFGSVLLTDDDESLINAS